MPELAKLAAGGSTAFGLTVLLWFLNQRFGRDQKSIDEARGDRDTWVKECADLRKENHSLHEEVAEVIIDLSLCRETSAHERTVQGQKILILLQYGRMMREMIRLKGGDPPAEPDLDVSGTGTTPRPRQRKKEEKP